MSLEAITPPASATLKLTDEQVKEVEAVFEVRWIPYESDASGRWKFWPHGWDFVTRGNDFSGDYNSWASAVNGAWSFLRCLKPGELDQIKKGEWDQ